MCGDFAVDNEELVSTIIENAEKPMKMHDLREERRKFFMTYERADSCEAIYKNICSNLNQERIM